MPLGLATTTAIAKLMSISRMAVSIIRLDTVRQGMCIIITPTGLLLIDLHMGMARTEGIGRTPVTEHMEFIALAIMADRDPKVGIARGKAAVLDTLIANGTVSSCADIQGGLLRELMHVNTLMHDEGRLTPLKKNAAPVTCLCR